MSQMKQSGRRAPEQPSRAPATRLHTRVEHLHIRNFDPDRRYTIDILLSISDGSPAYRRSFDVAPRGVESAFELVPPGHYTVDVTATFEAVEQRPFNTSGTTTDSAEVDLGESVDQTIAIECGNGIVSVSEGLSF